MEKRGPVDFLLVLKIKNVVLAKKFYGTRKDSYLRLPVIVGDRSITQRNPMYDLAVSWYS
jgi:hypothetical protein